MHRSITVLSLVAVAVAVAVGVAALTPQAARAQTDQMRVVVNGRTVQEWFDRAMDRSQVKTNREEAIQVLQQAGNSGAFALFQLLQAKDVDTVDPNAGFGFNVPKGYVRWKAAEALGNMGQIGLRSAPHLARMMKSDEIMEVRLASAIAIGRLGSREASVVEALKDVLRGTDYTTWQGAVFALGKITPLDAESRELLGNIANADPYKVAPRGPDVLWTAVMNARTEARSALLPR